MPLESPTPPAPCRSRKHVEGPTAAAEVQAPTSGRLGPYACEAGAGDSLFLPHGSTPATAAARAAPRVGVAYSPRPLSGAHQRARVEEEGRSRVLQGGGATPRPPGTRKANFSALGNLRYFPTSKTGVLRVTEITSILSEGIKFTCLSLCAFPRPSGLGMLQPMSLSS